MEKKLMLGRILKSMKMYFVVLDLDDVGGR